MKKRIMGSIAIINLAAGLSTSTKTDYKELTIQSYDTTAQQYADNRVKISPEKKAARFLAYLKPNAHILDIGCGPGKDAHYFIQRGYRVTGFDLSANMIKLARQKAPEARFHVMDIEHIDLPDNSFDALWASASLLHVPRDKFANILQTLHGLLKDKGIFYIAMKKGKGEAIKEDIRQNNVQKFWTYYSQDELVKYLEHAGFAILENYTYATSTTDQTHPWIAIICQKIPRSTE